MRVLLGLGCKPLELRGVRRRPLARGSGGDVGVRRSARLRVMAASGESVGLGDKTIPGMGEERIIDSSTALPDNFCIIEDCNTMDDIDAIEEANYETAIESRRNKIFLLMEEVRRLKVKNKALEMVTGIEPITANSEFPSALPFFPEVTPATIDNYKLVFGCAIVALILFGGLAAPLLEVRLGLGGTSYAEFIGMMHLPSQLAQVDPIVASFTGGAVGVISSLFVIELNNVKKEESKRCLYCRGTGYLSCGACAQSNNLNITETGSTRLISSSKALQCSSCSGTGKVMCTSCLCTGMALVTEHDPRIDPFD